MNATANYLRRYVKPPPANMKLKEIPGPHFVICKQRGTNYTWDGHIIGTERWILEQLDQAQWNVTKIVRGKQNF